MARRTTSRFLYLVALTIAIVLAVGVPSPPAGATALANQDSSTLPPPSFAVREWGIDVPLPTLETIEIVVPADLQPGEQCTFSCIAPGHQSLGQEGVITIVTPEKVLANQRTSEPDAFADANRDRDQG